LKKFSDDYIRAWGWEKMFPFFLKTGKIMEPQVPRDHLAELDAAATTGGWPRDLLVFGNTVPDLMNLLGCSALMVEGPRSATGAPLFARNVDWPAFGLVHDSSRSLRPGGTRGNSPPLSAVGTTALITSSAGGTAEPDTFSIIRCPPIQSCLRHSHSFFWRGNPAMKTLG
jgi:hypothetical protein